MMDFVNQHNLYGWIKAFHIFTSIVLLGTGFGSAFFKYRVDQIGNLSAIVFISKTVVLVDWLFTAPSVVLQPLTGLALARLQSWPLSEGWLIASMACYVLAALCWVPALYLQVRMRDVARHALCMNQPIPAEYRMLSTYWYWLGLCGFGAVVTIIPLMVVKPF